MKIKKVCVFMYLYRIFWMFFSLKIISKITVLGDYERYSNKNFYDVIKKIELENTFVTEMIFSFVKLIFKNNILLVNLLFCILSTYSILFLLKRFNYKKEILLLLLFPSFNIWSSYISKEILYVILISFFLSLYIDSLMNLKFSKTKKILFVFLFISILIMKKQYSVFWVLILEYLVLKKKFRVKLNNINYIYIVQTIIFIIIIYIFKNRIDLFFRNFYLNFHSGNSSRNLDFFHEKYGFFKHIIYGIYISIQGVEIKELFDKNIIKIVSFLESTVILCYLIYTFFKKKLINKFYYLFPILNVLIIQYPFAIFNSGAAIRYRTNIYIILIILPYLISKRRNNIDELY